MYRPDFSEVNLYRSNVEILDPTADITFNVITNPFKGYHIILDISSFDVKTVRINTKIPYIMHH